MKNSKYSLCNTDLVTPNGKPLFRIVAERDVRLGVRKGDEGGLVESAANLAIDGSAWVSGNARVSGDARVYGNHKIVSGWAFATKHPDWSITEIQVGDYVTLVKDGVFEPTEPEPTCAGKIVEIDGKQYELREVTK